MLTYLPKVDENARMAGFSTYKKLRKAEEIKKKRNKKLRGSGASDGFLAKKIEGNLKGHDL